MRALRAGKDALAEDNKAAASTIRAKDKQLDVAAVRVEEARIIAMKNKARLHPIPNPYLRPSSPWRTRRACTQSLIPNLDPHRHGKHGASGPPACPQGDSCACMDKACHDAISLQ